MERRLLLSLASAIALLLVFCTFLAFQSRNLERRLQLLERLGPLEPNARPSRRDAAAPIGGPHSAHPAETDRISELMLSAITPARPGGFGLYS